MANITAAVLTLLALTMASLLVMGVNQDNSNLLFKIAMDPTSIPWDQVRTWLAYTSMITLAGALIGQFIFKNDVFIFATLFGTFTGLAHPVMVSFYSEFAASWNPQVAMLIIAPIYITYEMACLIWLRTGR